jgi:hypothetical protein
MARRPKNKLIWQAEDLLKAVRASCQKARDYASENDYCAAENSLDEGNEHRMNLQRLVDSVETNPKSYRVGQVIIEFLKAYQIQAILSLIAHRKYLFETSQRKTV